MDYYAIIQTLEKCSLYEMKKHVTNLEYDPNCIK